MWIGNCIVHNVLYIHLQLLRVSRRVTFGIEVVWVGPDVYSEVMPHPKPLPSNIWQHCFPPWMRKTTACSHVGFEVSSQFSTSAMSVSSTECALVDNYDWQLIDLCVSLWPHVEKGQVRRSFSCVSICQRVILLRSLSWGNLIPIPLLHLVSLAVYSD